MDKPVVRISVRNLVEFILRSGDLDNRGGSSDREAMQKGSRLHRKIQGRMGSHYRAEVSLKYKTEYEDVGIQVEGRADGIFTEDGQCWIDEIKGVYADVSQLEKPVEVHRAQAMCYAWIYAQEQKPEKIGVQMTYGNLDTEELKFFREEYTLEELGLWYQNLLDRYHKWIAYQLAWKKERNASMSDLEFPFEYREGQRKIVSGVYHTISTERQIFVQAPTGVGKTMSTIFPAVRAVGAGLGENIFYLTAKTITRTVAEEAFSILKEHGLKFKVITITAKEKLCFCDKTECNPENCLWASLGNPVIVGHTFIHSCQFCIQGSGSAVKHHQNRRRTEGPASCFADTDGRSGHFGTGLTVQNAHAGDIVIHQKTHNKITFSGEILSLIFGQSVIFSYGICQKLLQFQHFGNLMPGKHTAH